ncbi:MAG: tetratricopeptide repeat protein [Prevotella sp.]|nr:tetratricopeptide repeat protein [Prevotella sp.]MBQ8701316.1 tetratricopeptide repeat protein [Prevotella sp.]MBQ9651233.1 tetratricopeptide repeat protein [Prevotella sp.]
MRHSILILFIAIAATLSAQTDRQFIREGNRQYRSKQYEQAEVSYRKALSKNSENPQAAYNLGCALMMQQKDSAALEQYKKAAVLEKEKDRLAKVYHNIGVMMQNHQQYDQAIEAYKQSLRNNPHDNETRYNLALCQQLRKKQPQNQNNQNNKKNQKDQKDKNDQNKDKNQNKDNDNNKDDKQQQPQPQPEQMSRENAEQLLNAAMQEEKATQQRMKKAMQQPSRRNVQKNW